MQNLTLLCDGVGVVAEERQVAGVRSMNIRSTAPPGPSSQTRGPPRPELLGGRRTLTYPVRGVGCGGIVRCPLAAPRSARPGLAALGAPPPLAALRARAGPQPVHQRRQRYSHSPGAPKLRCQGPRVRSATLSEPATALDCL